MAKRNAPRFQDSKQEDRSFTAPIQHRFLNDAIEGWKDPRDQTVPVREIPALGASENIQADGADSDKSRRIVQALRRNKKPLIKSAVAILVAGALGWAPLERMLLTSSAEAFINARTIVVRAPISGQVTLASSLKIGSSVGSGEQLVLIQNRQADATHIDSLNRAAAQVRTNLAALTSKEAALLKFRGLLRDRAERYRIGRVEAIETQISAIDAQIAAAAAQYEQGKISSIRSQELLAKGATSQAAFDQAQRDSRVAQESLKSLQERRKGLSIERDAALEGTFLTEGYSDASQSAQRNIDIELELADLRERIKGSEAELHLLQSDIEKEGQRIRALSTATIPAGADARIWEVSVSSGEFVNAGDVLMRMLDCAYANVTAVVTGNTYQKLRIGQQATFRPKDGGPDLRGWVSDLSGLARAGRNEAIQPSAFTRADYHVTLSFPDLETRQDCGLSRSGLVVFD